MGNPHPDMKNLPRRVFSIFIFLYGPLCEHQNYEVVSVNCFKLWGNRSYKFLKTFGNFVPSLCLHWHILNFRAMKIVQKVGAKRKITCLQRN